MRHILCIDDSVTRYLKLYRMAAERGILLTITDNPEIIRLVLGHKVKDCPLVGICLDHDMPGRDAVEIARDILGSYNVPVVIVSNNHDGALNLSDVLTEYAVPHVRMPAGFGFGWEEDILDWLTAQEGKAGG